MKTARKRWSSRPERDVCVLSGRGRTAASETGRKAADVTTRSRFGTGLVVVAVVLSACGGETGEQVQRDIEEKIRTEVREARQAATEEARSRAKAEIERLERRAKRELRENGARRIEQVSDRAQREVDRVGR